MGGFTETRRSRKDGERSRGFNFVVCGRVFNFQRGKLRGKTEVKVEMEKVDAC